MKFFIWYYSPSLQFFIWNSSKRLTEHSRVAVEISESFMEISRMIGFIFSKLKIFAIFTTDGLHPEHWNFLILLKRIFSLLFLSCLKEEVVLERTQISSRFTSVISHKNSLNMTEIFTFSFKK